MKRLHPLFAGILLIGAGFAPAAGAHSGRPISIDELTRISGVIVEGTVRSVDSEWNTERTQIYTTVALDVQEYLKGGSGRGLFRFRQLGGTVDDMTLAIVGQPNFQPGEAVFLFMNPDWTVGPVPVLGGEMGTFRVATDSRTGRVVLQGHDTTVERGSAVQRIRRLTAALE